MSNEGTSKGCSVYFQNRISKIGEKPFAGDVNTFLTVDITVDSNIKIFLLQDHFSLLAFVFVNTTFYLPCESTVRISRILFLLRTYTSISNSNFNGKIRHFAFPPSIYFRSLKTTKHLNRSFIRSASFVT